MNVQFIAIVGGSGSGKSWLAARLRQAFGRRAGRLVLDDFYRDQSAVPQRERAQVNYDHPNAIDWPLWQRCLGGIARNEPVALPQYDFATHARRTATSRWLARPLVILDGLWLLRRKALRQQYAITIFVDCPESLRLTRRLERDQRERGRSARSVRHQFARQVAPMHRRFVATQKRHAQIVVPSPMSPADLRELIQRLRRELDSANS